MASHDFASTYVGTPFYMSPEICAEERYTHQSDIWSLGCIMYELCARRPPFNARTHLDLIRKIRLGQVEPLPAEYSSELQNVIKTCLNTNAQRRPDTATLLALPQVRLMRKEREVVEIARVLKMKEEQVVQRAAELEEKAMTLKSAQCENGKIRDEIEAIVRREWEVKARLEIDRRVQIEVESLQRTYQHDVHAQAEMEVERRMRALESNSNSQPSSQNSSQSGMTTTTSLSAETDATDLSLLSIDSPTSSADADSKCTLPPRKQARTPFTRARTQVYDSPMDVHMVECSPMSIASLSLSPRRTAALLQHGAGAGAASKNIFAAVLEQRDQREQKWKPLTATSEDGETLDCDETDDLPDLPSPTSRPFKSAPGLFPVPTSNNNNNSSSSSIAQSNNPFFTNNASGRPLNLLQRQNTAPSFPQRLQPQPSLFAMHKNGIAPVTGSSNTSVISTAFNPGIGSRPQPQPQPRPASASSLNKNGSPALVGGPLALSDLGSGSGSGSGSGPSTTTTTTAMSHPQGQGPQPSQQVTRGAAAPITSLPAASPNRRLSKLPPVISEAGSPIQMRRAPPAPPSSKNATGPGGLKSKQVLAGGDEMLRAVVQRNMNSGSGNAGAGGRTLVELAQARAGGGHGNIPVFGSHVPKYNNQRTENNDENVRPSGVLAIEDEVPIWDPERDEMPSPFIQRGKKVGLGIGFDLRR